MELNLVSVLQIKTKLDIDTLQNSGKMQSTNNV
jgi:hypothetical protein